MEKTIGLDLGTNSVGWAIRDESILENQIVDWGVLTFDKGVAEVKGIESPKTANRTDKRGKRRNYQARKYRKQSLLALLIENGMCPLSKDELDKWRKYDNGRKYPKQPEFIHWIRLDFNADGIADYSNPYLLRHEVATIKLENPFLIGRALYHLTQRRGFAGGKGDTDEETRLIAEGSKKKGTKGRDEIKNLLGEKTLGSVYASFDSNKERIRNRYNLRDDVEKELQTICQTQGIALDSQLYQDLRKAIIWQRPLRTQKGTVGICTLEKGKRRCQLSHPYYELYSAWSIINNIKLKPKDSSPKEFKFLTEEQRQKVYKEIFLRKEAHFDFEDISKKLDKQGNYDFNYRRHQNITGCLVSAYMYSIFGENWLSTQIKKEASPKSGKDHYDIEDIWHVLVTFNNPEQLQNFGKNNLGLIDEQLKQLNTLFKKMPEGYGSLSLAAIKKILLQLETGLIYSEAVMTANLNKVFGRKLDESELSFINKRIKQEINEYEKEKSYNNIANSLIADHLDLPDSQRFQYDENHQLDNDDKTDIERTLIQQYGEKSWMAMEAKEQDYIRNKVASLYLDYLRKPVSSKKFIRTERRDERVKKVLVEEFSASEMGLKNLYHHSDIDIYPAVKEDENNKKYLGSPIPPSNGFKNPMAMKTLYKMKLLINYLIKTGKIDEDTKVIVEVPRELTTANKRKAWFTWQNERRKENVEFAKAIIELAREKHLELNPEDPENIDKFRLWFDQLEKRDDVYKSVTALKADIDKYRLWKEQDCRCLYTNKVINVTDLFSGNFDFEHTIPASMSFDNSLANKTVCDRRYNRDIKKKKIPTELANYLIEAGGFSAIEPRLSAWDKRVEFLKDKIQEYVRKAKYASTKDGKDFCIQKRHYYEFELEYWDKKLWTFTTLEYKAGWKNSQLVDTGIVSKYAFHYLKTVFPKVYVQKGEVTSIFRKIYEIQGDWDIKSRTKHSHHAMDAATLTLIPTGREREKLLQKYFDAQEAEERFHTKPYNGFHQSQLKKIEEGTIINLLADNKQLIEAKKYVRVRGERKFNVDENGDKNYWIAQGDTIRGQLHKESFFGAIKDGKKDEQGKLLRNESGAILQHDAIRFVIRKPLEFGELGFTKKEQLEKIVDPIVRKKVLEHIGERSLKEAFAETIWMNEEKGIKIRHVRTYKDDVTEPLEIKQHRDLNPNKAYKHYYYAENGENIICAVYQKIISDKKGNNKIERTLEIISLKEAADLLSHGLLDEEKQIEIFQKDRKGNVIIDENGNKQKPYAILKPGGRVIFYDEDIYELKPSGESEIEYKKRISFRMYYLTKFSGGQITFQHHLEARDNDALGKAYPKDQVYMIDEKGKEKKYGVGGTSGFTKAISDSIKVNGYNNYEPWPKLLYTKDWLNMAIEGKHFEINSDGTIQWKL
jgi:CRISPR-associated endonuclease Csn1